MGSGGSRSLLPPGKPVQEMGTFYFFRHFVPCPCSHRKMSNAPFPRYGLMGGNSLLSPAYNCLGATVAIPTIQLCHNNAYIYAATARSARSTSGFQWVSNQSQLFVLSAIRYVMSSTTTN